MRCEEIMSQDVQWIRRDETVARTAKLMAFTTHVFPANRFWAYARIGPRGKEVPVGPP